MIKQKLITKAMLAKLSGVTRSGVTRAANTNLKSALVGNKIDSNHPDVVNFLNRHKALKSAKEEIKNNNREIKVEKYLDLTLREVVEHFGTDVEFAEWLKAAKSIEDIKEKRIKNEMTLGNLIPRDYVKTHIFSLIETANVRLLNDSPRTITARVLEAHKSGQSREKIEKLVCELISVQLKGIKLRARRKLHAE